MREPEAGKKVVKRGKREAEPAPEWMVREFERLLHGEVRRCVSGRAPSPGRGKGRVLQRELRMIGRYLSVKSSSLPLKREVRRGNFSPF